MQIQYSNATLIDIDKKSVELINILHGKKFSGISLMLFKASMAGKIAINQMVHSSKKQKKSKCKKWRNQFWINAIQQQQKMCNIVFWSSIRKKQQITILSFNLKRFICVCYFFHARFGKCLHMPFVWYHRCVFAYVRVCDFLHRD